MGAVLRARTPVATLDRFALSARAAQGRPDRRIRMYEERSGWVTFAGVMLLIAGVLNIIYGIAAIGDSSFFLANTRYILSNLNTWGWVTLVLGLFQLFAAFSLWSGGLYGRIVGILAASLSAIVALLSIPAYPLWSLALFAIDIVIIHQIATRGTEGRGVEADTVPPAATRSRTEGTVTSR
jgi:hypothetical protein